MTTKPESLMRGVVMAIFLVAAVVVFVFISYDDIAIDQDLSQKPAALSVTGSTTIAPLAEMWAQVFNERQSAILVSVQGSGTATGIRDVATDVADIAMASRKVNDQEVDFYGDGFEEFLISYDAISIIVSKPIRGSGVTNLNRDEVGAIYSGKITNWKNLGGPDQKIYVVARSAGSGTGDVFNEKITTPGVAIYCDSNAEVRDVIMTGDNAIGYLSSGYAQDCRLCTLAYEGVLPSSENITNGSYHLSRELYMYTWGVPDENERAFLKFVLGKDGQTLVQGAGLVPVLE